jgi:hypothetical protein
MDIRKPEEVSRRVFLAGVTGLGCVAALAGAPSWHGGFGASRQGGADWHLDDICNSYPPYAFPVVPAPFVATARSGGDGQPADHHWIP